MEKILGIAIVNGKAMAMEVNDDLEAWYELLGCNTIDITPRQIGKGVYDIICDDNGLFVEGNHISATNHFKEPMFVGNIFICKSFEGDLVSLTPNEILSIGKRLHRTRQLDKETGEVRTFSVVECDYPTPADDEEEE